MTHLSLFTGIGGIDLAAEWAGFETVGQVEWADYSTKVLEKHWPNVNRWRDIRDVTGDEVRRTIGNQNITLISGGFPCQPFSVAGKRKGKDDNRYLWPEMLRVIRELQPTWVLGENVAGFINMGLEDACADLENEGYAVQAFVIPACGVGAYHIRKRVFVIANSNSSMGKTRMGIFKNRKATLCSSNTEKCIKFRNPTNTRNSRNNDGISSRMDRLKCIGNAVVPQQVYPILKAIADIEKGCA